jgi:regulatory factor X, other
VPTLNPASFGKLVRIIFPNVQTRRLGMRGESKYHYVDLDLVPEGQQAVDSQMMSTNVARPSTSGGYKEEPGLGNGPSATFDEGSRPVSRHDMETADFPVPEVDQQAEFAPIGGPVQDPQSIPAPTRLCCKHANAGTIQIPLNKVSPQLAEELPAVLPHLPATLHTYLAMPQPDLIDPENARPAPVELPDIAPYLVGIEHDSDAALTLYSLYRSHCTDIVEAFRKVMDKTFFQHYNAFNGKMTVPVSRLFGLLELKDWIQECDMRMYKAMARFVVPIIIQQVPEVVWGRLNGIAQRLVDHVISCFQEKSPVHVVAAKTVPAARFANLLKKLKTANAFTIQLSTTLDNADIRTSMWLDLLSMVDPAAALEESRPPPECLPQIRGILKHDIRTLLDPSHNEFTARAEEEYSAYSDFLKDDTVGAGVFSSDALDQPWPSPLGKWISWVRCLPAAFEHHHPLCMLDWHTRFWHSICHQLGDRGAKSFQFWWYAEAFTTSLLQWMAEMQGLLMSKSDQILADQRDTKKMAEVQSNASLLGKRMREWENPVDEPNDQDSHRHKRPSLEAARGAAHPSSPPAYPFLPPESIEEPELPELPRGKQRVTNGDLEDDTRPDDPNKLPSLVEYHISSPVKLSREPPNHMIRIGHSGLNNNDVDDSGIGADLDDEEVVGAVTGTKGKGREHDHGDWLLNMTSDAVEPVP